MYLCRDIALFVLVDVPPRAEQDGVAVAVVWQIDLPRGVDPFVFDIHALRENGERRAASPGHAPRDGVAEGRESPRVELTADDTLDLLG